MKQFIDQCRIALNPMLRDMISRGQAIRLIEDHFSADHNWLIRKVPNTKDEYYIDHGNPPEHVRKVYGIV